MREYIQAWYDAWLAEHRSTDLLYVNRDRRGDPYLEQLHFVRDALAPLLWRDVPYDDRPNEEGPRSDLKATAIVVGEHRSKSVRLPVYQLERPDLGLIVTLRDNFYDWNVSASTERAVSADAIDGFPSTQDYLFFQGFPDDRRFGSHASNPCGFSLCLIDKYQVYTFLWNVLREVRRGNA